MILNLFRAKAPDPVDAVYLEVVLLARSPRFYLDFCVPDTVEGRFEMILLHLALLFHRLRDESEASQKVAQKVVNAFFSDMDRTLREMGIGDISVPKKIKKLGDAYNGRMLAYHRALDAADNGDLAAIVMRNVMAIDQGQETDAQRAGADGIASYGLASADRLKAQPIDEILAGTLAVASLEVTSPTPLTGATI